MQSIHTTQTQINGYAVLPYAPTRSMSNVVTLLTSSNHMPSMYRDFTIADLRQWRTTALTLSDKSIGADLMRMMADPTVKVTPALLFLRDYTPTIARLMSDPTYHRDAGALLADELTETEQWEQLYVSMPALGFARRYLSLRGELALAPESFSSQLANDEGAHRAIADLLMLLDRPAFSDALIPEAKSLKLRDAKDPIFGPAQAALMQADRLTSIGLLYCAQAVVFIMRLQQPMWDLSFQLATALYPHSAAVLNWYKELRSTVLDSIPAHPLLASIAANLQTATILTQYGQKDCILRPVSDRCAMRVPGERRDVLARTVLVNALAEFARMRQLLEAGVDWPLRWVNSTGIMADSSANTMRTFGSDSTGMVFSEVIEWIHMHEKHVQEWANVSRSLGWGNAVSAGAHTIDALGADYVICNGEGYTADPRSVLLGLRPSLSAGNKLVMSVGPVYDKDFGTGAIAEVNPLVHDGGDPKPAAFEWSTLVTTGRSAPTDRSEILSRFYMPLGMLMGEDGYETQYVHAEAMDDRGKAVIEYYRARSPNGYVRPWYGQPTATRSVAENGTYSITMSWDAVAWGADAAVTQNALLGVFGRDNVEKTMDTLAFKSRWNMRVPARMSRSNHFEWYDELGAHTANVPFHGLVLFDDNVEGNFDVSGVDAFANLLPLKAPQLPSVDTAEVAPPQT